MAHKLSPSFLTRQQWQYFVPIQEHMPQNCSRDVALVIDYVDGVLEHETFTNKQSLKEMFGLKGLAYDDDFARRAILTCSDAIRAEF